MNYTIALENSEDTLVVKTKGKMSAHEYLAMAGDLLKHPKRKSDGCVLFDHTDLDFSDARVDDLEKIRSFHRENESRIGDGKSAVLLKRGFSRSWHKLWSQGQKIQTGNKVQVFENRDDAVKWLEE